MKYFLCLFISLSSFALDNTGKTDVTAQLQKMLDTQGEVILPKGRFQVKGLRLNRHRLSGAGTIFSPDTTPALIITGPQVTIDGLSFNSMNTKGLAEIQLTESTDFLSIQNCHFQGDVRSAITADINGTDDQSLKFKRPAKKILITQSEFKGYVSPLYLHSVEHLTVTNNFFAESQFDAIRLRQNVKYAIISQNHFENIGTAKELMSRDAIDAYWSGQKLIISQNIVRKTSAHGFDIKGIEPQGKYGLKDVIISDNILEQIGYSGILISAELPTTKGLWPTVGNVIIKGNIVTEFNQTQQDIDYAGIWLHHGLTSVIVDSNIVDAVHGHGISVTNWNKKAPKNQLISITNNLVQNCQTTKKIQGIKLHPTNLLILSQNNLKGCPAIEAINLPK